MRKNFITNELHQRIISKLYLTHFSQTKLKQK